MAPTPPRSARSSISSAASQSLWAKVKELDFMLRTTGNESSIEALESIADIASEMRDTGEHLVNMCRKTDALIEHMEPETWKEAIFDDWDVIRQCGCDMTQEVLMENFCIFEELGQDIDVPTLPPSLQTAPCNKVVEHLRTIREALTSPELGQRETLHVAPSLCKMLQEMHSFSACDDTCQQEALLAIKEICCSLDGKQSSLKKNLREATLKDDTVGVLSSDITHKDMHWSWGHRYNLKLAMKQMQESEHHKSLDSLQLQLCDASQRLVKLDVKKIASLANKVKELNKMKETHQEQVKKIELHCSCVLSHKEMLVTRCKKDIASIAATMQQRETQYQQHSAGEIREKQKKTMQKVMTDNTKAVTETIDVLVSLLNDRYSQMKQFLHKLHVDARRDGEREEFMRYSNLHTKRLQEYVEKCNKCIELYKQQNVHHTHLINFHSAEVGVAEKMLFTSMVDTHADHLRHVYKLHSALRSALKAKKVKMTAASQLIRCMKKEAHFCTATNDERELSVEADMHFLEELRANSGKVIAKITVRLHDIKSQTQWSLDALQKAGVTPPAQFTDDMG